MHTIDVYVYLNTNLQSHKESIHISPWTTAKNMMAGSIIILNVHNFHLALSLCIYLHMYIHLYAYIQVYKATLFNPSHHNASKSPIHTQRSNDSLRIYMYICIYATNTNLTNSPYHIRPLSIESNGTLNIKEITLKETLPRVHHATRSTLIFSIGNGDSIMFNLLSKNNRSQLFNKH